LTRHPCYLEQWGFCTPQAQARRLLARRLSVAASPVLGFGEISPPRCWLTPAATPYGVLLADRESGQDHREKRPSSVSSAAHSARCQSLITHESKTCRINTFIHCAGGQRRLNRVAQLVIRQAMHIAAHRPASGFSAGARKAATVESPPRRAPRSGAVVLTALPPTYLASRICVMRISRRPS